MASSSYKDDKINFPFMMYPSGGISGNLLHGWTNFDVCKKEVVRLHNHLLEYKPKKKTLFFLVVGAAMEEISNEDPYYKHQQWKQLFPDYISEYCANPKNICKIVIVSPNTSFEKGVPPVFISKTTHEFNWIKRGEGGWISKNGNTTIDIFCTAMPCEDRKMNNLKIKKLRSIDIFQNEMYKPQVEQMYQNNEDVKFVDSFYQTVGQLFDNIERENGTIVCHSYASFNSGSNNSKYNNYYMFPKLTEYFPTMSSSRVLAEWIHDPTCKQMVLYTGVSFIRILISYCYNSKSELTVLPCIVAEGDKLFIRYDVYSPYFRGITTYTAFIHRENKKFRIILESEPNFCGRKEVLDLREDYNRLNYASSIICTSVSTLRRVINRLDRNISHKW